MPDYITTYGGTHFVPTKPESDKIHVTDIAHALSLICRGNGHLKTFFSVGQHCIYCAKEASLRGYSRRLILACLLHDASEAYMSDVPRPFKQYLKEYNEFEEKLLDMIYIKYLGSTLSDEEVRLLKRVDDDLLYYDLTILLGEPVEGPAPELKIDLDYTFRPFEDVEREYLELFSKYGGN